MRAWLHDKGVELEERDFFKDRLTERELRQLLGERTPSSVFAWNSPSFKALGLAAEELDDEAVIGLMLREPRLIRRPLLVVGKQLVVGGAQKTLDAAFP
ncbi:MAG: hypothetical protein HYY31_05655 [Chloroflexi bacterium]|nr:hypothetical protein [Chloroflexota bacterium]